MKKALLLFVCLTIPFNCFCSYKTDNRGKMLREPFEGYNISNSGHPQWENLTINNDPIPEVLLAYDLLQRTNNSSEEAALKMRIKTLLLLYMDNLCDRIDLFEIWVQNNLQALDNNPSQAQASSLNSEIYRYRNAIETYFETIRHVGEFMDKALETKREAA